MSCAVQPVRQPIVDTKLGSCVIPKESMVVRACAAALSVCCAAALSLTHIDLVWRQLIGAWSFHYNKKYFGEDCKQFRPERWLDEQEPPISRYPLSSSSPSLLCSRLGWHSLLTHFVCVGVLRNAFFSFGGQGPRTCIGQQFTMSWQRSALAQMIAQFSFSLAKPSEEARYTTKGLFQVPVVNLLLTPRPAAAAK